MRIYNGVFTQKVEFPTCFGLFVTCSKQCSKKHMGYRENSKASNLKFKSWIFN